MSGAATLDDANALAMVSDARWFPVDLELRGQTFEFAQTSEDELAGEAFASLALWRPKGARRRLSIAKTLATWPDRAPPPIDFIWHTGFCASTLISRVFDKAGRNLSLREPDILSVLADIKRARLLADPRYKRLPRTVLGLLARPLAQGSRILTKPTPAANLLAAEAAEQTTGKMLFLYADLKTYLIAVARGGEARRGVIRTLFSTIASDGNLPNAWTSAQLFAMPDLQIAAIVWHLQIAQMRKNMDALGERAASLDCDVFLKNPERTITRLDAFFGLGLGEEHAKDVADGPLLRRHAKTGRPVAAPWENRNAEHDVEVQFARDVDQLVKWSYSMFKTPPGTPLPRPLEKIEIAQP